MLEYDLGPEESLRVPMSATELMAAFAGILARLEMDIDAAHGQRNGAPENRSGLFDNGAMPVDHLLYLNSSPTATRYSVSSQSHSRSTRGFGAHRTITSS